MNDIPTDGGRVPPPKRGDFAPQPKLDAPAGPPALSGIRIGCSTLESFEFTQRVAKAWTMNEMVPMQYRHLIPSKADKNQLAVNPVALGNAMVAIDMADRMRCGVLQIMQNLYVIEGRPSFKAEFVIGLVNDCGRFSQLRFETVDGPEIEAEYVSYKWEGPQGSRRRVETIQKVRIPDTKWRAWARDLDTGDRLDGPWITMRMAVAEGWYGKEGSKWQTIPHLMGCYRAGAWWQRLYAPQLTAGYRTMEEEAEIIDAHRVGPDSYDATETVRHVHTPPAQPSATPEPTEPQPPAHDQAAPQAGEQSDPKETGGSGEGFEANLIDADGFILGEPFTDALAFIDALIALAAKATDLEALLEHNEGSIADARDADIMAQVAFDEWRTLPAETEARPEFEDLHPAMIRGKLDWPAYVQQLTELIKACPVGKMERFIAHHRTIMESAPQAFRLQIVKAINVRYKELTMGVPPSWVAAMINKPQADKQPLLPADEAQLALSPQAQAAWPAATGMQSADWVAAIVTWLDGMRDYQMLVTFLGDATIKERMRWLADNRRPLHDQIDVAIQAARARFPEAGGDP